ncbi:MAG: molybdate ABC transporter substrate-binding protein [Azospirillaceae bacterium]|nr:molybdate ABC transporter substrate-binding protein [Azospirillaceae bacterium]
MKRNLSGTNVGAWLRGLAVATTLILMPFASHAADVTVYAAASLKDALDTLGKDWQTKTGKTFVASYAASSTLARQIENKAPADVFISADLDWMNWLADRKLIKPESRFNLLGNALVLITQAGNATQIHIAPGFPLAQLVANSRLASGDPAHVPAGIYAQAALEKLGVWAAVEPRLARADSVRSALALVSRGEALFGIVYATDAMADKGVRVVDTFPADSHPPIIYPAALTATTTSADAASFLEWLKSADAQAVFARFGFTPAPASAG